ncbi:MAG TPA: hypothetical protein VH437_07495 [Terriglobales bacterium]|jgi:hypothetical protein
MRRSATILSFLLVGTLYVPLLTGFALAAAVPTAQSAGCHHHGGTKPAPRPADYTCCQAGHNSAILQAEHVVKVSLSATLSQRFSSSLSSCTSNFVVQEIILSSSDPPGITTLRI